jgi:hypothetical protein
MLKHCAMENHHDKLRDVCQETASLLKKFGDSKSSEIQSKLDYVVGSYNYDHNPTGLYEIGNNALQVLKEIKAKNPKKVSKQAITTLEECLKD